MEQFVTSYRTKFTKNGITLNIPHGLKLPEGIIPEGIHVIENRPPYQTVGKAKNKALKYLINADCDHIFLIENDIIIKSSTKSSSS
jgi:hypothetical protein